MTRVQNRLVWAVGLTTAAALGVLACGGGGGGSSSPTSPSPGGGSSAQPTITITANGVDPKVLDIRTGQRVRFVNSDGRTHEIYTTPHGAHTDCPAINAVGTLAAGADRMTNPLETARICGYHDHQNPDDQKFRGQINVDTSEGPAPGYIRP
jgi:plastocyanin